MTRRAITRDHLVSLGSATETTRALEQSMDRRAVPCSIQGYAALCSQSVLVRRARPPRRRHRRELLRGRRRHQAHDRDQHRGAGGGGTLTTGSDGAGGFISAGITSGGCQQLTIAFEPQTPTVMVLVDRSGSMFDSGFWDPLKTAVLKVVRRPRTRSVTAC